jgi:predicted Ser/Thr protein kinase
MEHPNIVKYLGHATHDGHRAMVMECVKGKELRQNTQTKRKEAIGVLEKASQLGLGRQAPYAETLRKNWISGR